MPSKKTEKRQGLTPSQEAMLNRLVAQDSYEDRQRVTAEFGLECDLMSAQPSLEGRLAAAKLLEEAKDAFAAALQAERVALVPCVAGYQPKLEVGWITPEFVAELSFQGLRSSELERVKRALYALNLKKPYEHDANRLISYVGPAYRTSPQTERRLRNLLRLVWDGDRVVGVRGNYEFSLRQAQALAEWAIDVWKSESYSRVGKQVTRRVRYDGESHAAIIYATHIEIGCQVLAREEITRIAALMGWGGFPEMEGPGEPPAEEPKPVRKRSLKQARALAVSV